MKQEVRIEILRQHWAKDDGKDDEQDLCSHGELYIQIGQEVISSEDSGSWTLSATAIYLIRTLVEDYKIGDYASQLVPCCGHVFSPDESGEYAIFMGCSSGVDWNIKHIGNNIIEHRTENGSIGRITNDDYKSLVTRFVKEVDEFYTSSADKVLPIDKHDREGYLAFKKEWSNSLKELEKSI